MTSRWVPVLPILPDLWDRFLTEYPGPGGGERYAYTLDLLLDTAARASLIDGVIVSGDVAADAVDGEGRRPSSSPWTRGKAEDVGAVPADGPGDANVIMRLPADTSVFRSHELDAEVGGRQLRLADETQILWDLQDLGDEDRMEAAGLVREWLLHR